MILTAKIKIKKMPTVESKATSKDGLVPYSIQGVPQCMLYFKLRATVGKLVQILYIFCRNIFSFTARLPNLEKKGEEEIAITLMKLFLKSPVYELFISHGAYSGGDLLVPTA